MRTKILAVITFLYATFFIVSLYDQCYFESKEVISDLAKLQTYLSSSRVCTRSKAALDIQRLGSTAEAAVPRLLELLDDPEPSVRWRSVAALGYIGYFPPFVRESIYKMMDDEYEITRLNTLFAISRIKVKPGSKISDESHKISDETLEIFLRGLSDPSSMVRYKALIHLNTDQIIENEAKYKAAYQEVLFNLTSDNDPKVEGMALAQFGKLIGFEVAQREIPEFESRISSFIESDNEMVRRAANLTLAEMEGKKYPVLLEMPEGSADKAREEGESGEKVFGGCYHYAELLKYQGNMAEALKYKEACSSGAILEEHLRDLNNALAGYEKLCFDDRMQKACGKIHRVAVNIYSTEELKNYFKRICNDHDEIRSCGLLAAIYDKEGNSKGKDEYFDKAVKLAEIQCATGDKDACVGKALFICSSGEIEKGKNILQELCDEFSPYCRYVELCSEALNNLLEDLVPRM
jgi:HEAT repeat protein